MQRVSIRIAAALLTFTVGLALSSSWLFHSRPILNPIKSEQPFEVQPFELQPLSFSGMAHACGPTANYHSYESSDGIAISESNEIFPSAKRSNKELQKRVRLAVEIIEREPKLDENGRRVGERVVGISSVKEGQQLAFVMWTDDEILSSIEASSLRHVLEFEKR